MLSWLAIPISNKNNVIGVTETNITDPSFLGLHVEKVGT